MGRTFLDIDMARAADLLGMERRQAEQIRDLQRGHFLGLGPAIARRPVAVRIGAVKTRSRAVSHALEPRPLASSEQLHALVHAEWAEDAVPPEPAGPAAVPLGAEELLVRIEAMPAAAAEAAAYTPGELPLPPAQASEGAIAEILGEMAAEVGATYQPAAVLFQDFSVRCRVRRIAAPSIDVTQFRRRFAMAVAGIRDPSSEGAAEILRVARVLSEDVLAPFLLMALAAQSGAPCPEDGELARVYGTNSPGRIRRLLEHYEKLGLIVLRTDYSGRRSVVIPELGLSTAPVEA
jgi:hypothetical protein